MISLLNKPYCQKVLPLVYDDSLSYYEVLCKLTTKINELIELFNSYEEIINQLANLSEDITDMLEDISNIKATLITVRNELNNLESQYQNLVDTDTRQQGEIEELVNRVNNIVTSYDTLYSNMVAYVDNAIKNVEIGNQKEWIEFKVEVNSMIATLERQINDVLELIKDVPTDVYNPVRGRRVGFNKNNADIYQDLRYGGFTNAELSEFGVSNEHITTLVYNNRDLALFAKKRFKRYYVFSPVSGKEVSHANALSQVLTSAIGKMLNTAFYGYMETNNMTNDNLTELLTDNYNRYTVELGE